MFFVMLSHLAQPAERSIYRQREEVVHQLLKDLGQVNDPLLLQLQTQQNLDGDTERQGPGSVVHVSGPWLRAPLGDFRLDDVLQSGQVGLQSPPAKHFSQDLERVKETKREES